MLQHLPWIEQKNKLIEECWVLDMMSEFYSCQSHDEVDGIAMRTSGRDYPHDTSCIPSLAAKGDCRVSSLSVIICKLDRVCQYPLERLRREGILCKEESCSSAAPASW